MSAVISNLPPDVRAFLANPPSRGGGLNNWLFRAALLLHRYLKDDDEIIQLLEDAVEGEPLQPGEIERAVKNSRPGAWNPSEERRRWPKIDPALRTSVIAKGGTLNELHQASPSSVWEHPECTERIIDLLFPGDPLLCCGKSPKRFDTRPRSEWRGKLSALAFIVPNQMTAKRGLTQDGRESAHTLSNTGPRRYLVIEFDSGSCAEQCAILLHLAAMAPLVMAVHSGGKSIHGWFAAKQSTEDTLLGFMRYAVCLGADPALWSRFQFARMPGGMRDNGKSQTVHFLNPAAIP